MLNPSYRLSRHFTLGELSKSQTAIRLGICNIPADDTISNLEALCCHILEPVRLHFRRAFSPSSGYRCRSLNRVFRSSDQSQHTKGQAADFEVPDIPNRMLADWIDAHLDYDQLILEFCDPAVPASGWVHCSYRADGKNRKQRLELP